ncbi:heparinase II/III domain-containing protein [Saccharothrix sp. NRRL B-16314]|uniref:heparinase II/III domain-containing protein n=1 Tax=Saccharothrix sp. NRRL B-16314 TaxID=1463825 RepID=UPI0009DFA266|nr:heparinase II/III family protein [Saccharothrix sp. NRRL B-16314]
MIKPESSADRAVTGPLHAAWGARVEASALADLLLPPSTALPAYGDPERWPPNAATRPAALLDQARSERGTPWPQPTASQYARFSRDGDGDRIAYETPVFEHDRRLTRAVLAAVVTPDDALLDEVADGVVLLCERSTWCWPAHEEHHRLRGAVVPDPDVPYLDLGAGVAAAQLAWLDHVLGDRLDRRWPGLRARIRREVRVRVLDPFTSRRDWHWLGLDGNVHNWCPWICGNVLVAALRLVDDVADRARIAADAVRAIDRYLAALPPDGSVDEGFEYWWNGACRALEALDVLEHATAGALSATGVPVVRETVRFPRLMHLGGPWYVNLADARARQPGGQPWHVPQEWARRTGDRDVAHHAAAQRSTAITDTAELGRALRDLATPLPDHPVETLVGSAWLPGTQVGLARTTTGPTLVVKGGHNDENHNHNDVGSVIVAVDGVPVVVDAGRPTYTKQTFSADRYDIWTMQSSWHNVPEVRGTPQGTGRDHRARDVTAEDTADRFQVRLDLAPAYPVPALRSWWRTTTAHRDRQRVTIEDAWDFADHGDSPSTLHYLLAGDVVRDGPGRLVVHPVAGARATLVAWNPSLASAALTVRELDDPLLRTVWGEKLTRLELRLPDTARGSLVIMVEVCA